MRAIFLTVVLLPLLALGQRSCSASQNQHVTGLPADVPTFAASASVCCSLCAALSNCVAANFNASASLCERFANVTSTTPSAGSTVLQATGAPIPAPAEPHRRWSAETNTEEDGLQVNWAGIDGGFVTANGCERISLATGQHINNTCNATTAQLGFESSYTLDNHYVISNLFDVGVALVYPSPGWWLNLVDGSLLASQPVSFAAVDGRPPLAVALMNVNYFAVLTAFNLLNGSVVWRSASEYNFHQHVTYTVGKSGSTVLVAGGDSSGSAAATLFAFDSQTGIPLWTVKESTFLPAGYGTMVGGYIAANDKYAVTTLTSVGSSGSSFSLAIAEVATGAQQCTNYSFGTGDWVLIPDTLDVANKFLLWSTRSGNGAGVVEVLVFSIGVCRVVRRFIVEEVDGNTVQMFYDVQTRTVVAWAGNQVVAYRRDSDEQRWAYWFNPINTVTVGDGVVILSIGLGTEIIALDL